jgi:hypothetical protein
VLDTSSLSPADAAVALRSFPRRYREATRLHPGETAERILERPGLTGRSVIDLAVDAVRSLTLLHRALEQVLVEDGPTLHPAVRHRRERQFDTQAHGELEGVLAELDDLAPAFATTVERTHGDDWLRVARVVGEAEPVTALQVMQEAVGTTSDDLRDIEATVRQFRGTS